MITGFIEMEISILISSLTWIPWKMLKLQPQSAILSDLRLGIPIYNSKVPDTAGRQQQEEEHRQLQNVLRFK